MKVAESINFLLVSTIIVGGCQPNISATTEIDTPTATLSNIQQAEQVPDEYYTALINRDYTKTASLFTTMVGINRSDLIQLWEDNNNQGWRLTGYEIANQQQFNEKQIVFCLKATQEGMGPYQFAAINVLHLEETGWFVGDSTLDEFALLGRPQTYNQVTVFPGGVLRCVPGYEVRLDVKNDSLYSIIWGAEGETCGKLFFGSDVVQAICSTPSSRINAGEEANVGVIFLVDVLSRPVDDLPTDLDISVFQWDPDNNGIPDPASDPWTYHFDLKYDNP
jgi:hypothetical protein